MCVYRSDYRAVDLVSVQRESIVQDHAGTAVSLLPGIIVSLKTILNCCPVAPSSRLQLITWETLLAVVFFHCFRVSDSFRRVLKQSWWCGNDLSRHKNKKQNKKNMSCHYSPSAKKNGGELRPNKELEIKGFGVMWNSLGVICGFSKEQTYCILPGINWPERDRRDDTVSGKWS